MTGTTEEAVEAVRSVTNPTAERAARVSLVLSWASVLLITPFLVFSLGQLAWEYVASGAWGRTPVIERVAIVATAAGAACAVTSLAAFAIEWRALRHRRNRRQT